MSQGNKIDLGTYGSVNTEDVKEFAQNAGSKALDFGREKYAEFRKYADEGNWTWKIAGFLAGVLIVVLFTLAFISNFFGLSPFNAVLDIYLIAFGIIACLLEYKEVFFTQGLLNSIRKEALFLYRPYGRAGFYFFVGLLVVARGGLFGLVVGIYTIIVSIIIFQASRSAIKQLGVVRDGCFDEQQIAARFKEFDRNGDGCLDTTELAALTQSLGAKLSLNELEAALFLLDKNSDGKIQYSEFLDWWKGNDAHIV